MTKSFTHETLGAERDWAQFHSPENLACSAGLGGLDLHGHDQQPQRQSDLGDEADHE